MLEALDRGNLFVVPLDDRREWYRYHHLFADVLRARRGRGVTRGRPRAARAAPATGTREHGDAGEAIEHALAGGHVDRAADLMELAMPVLARDRQEAVLRAWVERLPEEVLAARPVLSNGYAGALMGTGQFDGVERHLRNAERWLEAPVDEQHESEMVVADDEGFRHLPAGVAVHRAGLALATGDPAATIAHAQRALDLLDEDHHIGHAAAAALIGLATWSGGDLEAARDAYTKSLANMRRAGHLADVLGLSIALADIQVTQGSLRDALHTYEQALRLNPEDGGPVLRGTADMYVGMSTVHRERNDLPAARQLLVQERGAGPAQRPAAEPVPLAGRDGPTERGRGRSRRGGGPARGRGAGVRRRLLAERAPGPRDHGTRPDPAGPSR